MITRLIQYECIDGKYRKVQSIKVEFIRITGSMSAVVMDKQGNYHIVRRKSLLDIPNAMLYPEMEKAKTEYVDYRTYTYFD